MKPYLPLYFWLGKDAEGDSRLVFENCTFFPTTHATIDIGSIRRKGKLEIGTWYAMKNFGLTALALLALTPSAHASIEWDFTPTAIVDCPFGNCVLTGSPVVALTLDGPDSSGSATYIGDNGPPILTGDPFAFSVADRGLLFSASPEHISTADPLGIGSVIQFELTIPPGIVPAAAVADYRISWTEVGGILDAVSISFDTVQDSISRLGLTGGRLASDFELGGCSVCDMTGVWTDSSSVPEPGTLALLLGALGVFGFRRGINAPLSSPSG